jgi:hypothetical protein
LQERDTNHEVDVQPAANILHEPVIARLSLLERVPVVDQESCHGKRHCETADVVNVVNAPFEHVTADFLGG